MVNVTCCGDQDRATKASETHPDRPPHGTRRCYSEQNPFKWDTCDNYNSACEGHGECDGCNADDSGGYCEIDDKIYVSIGSSFRELTGSELINRGRSDSIDTDIDIRRAMGDYDRKMTTKIREMQIMGRDPLPIPDRTTQTPSHDFVSDIMTNIGLGFGFFFMFFGGLIYIIESNLLKRIR
jgi:hypothetical protein